MISLYITLRNPFRPGKWHDLYQNEWRISKHKMFNVAFSYYRYNLFELNIDLNGRGSDHAGQRIALNIIGIELAIGIRDIRHWSIKLHTWEKND